MLGLTDYITEQTWEDILIATYVLVADRLEQAAQAAGFVRTRGPAPEYDDAQIITIALAAEFWFDGDEEKNIAFPAPVSSDLVVERRARYGAVQCASP